MATIASGFVIRAMTDLLSPQKGQLSTSIRNTLFRSSAQLERRREHRLLCCSGSSFSTSSSSPLPIGFLFSDSFPGTILDLRDEFGARTPE
jgi:hypothetical protein